MPRPQRPARPYPLTGDDNANWRAWERACTACMWSEGDWCMRAGAVVYDNGEARPLAGGTMPGGCSDWEARDA